MSIPRDKWRIEHSATISFMATKQSRWPLGIGISLWWNTSPEESFFLMNMQPCAKPANLTGV